MAEEIELKLALAPGDAGRFRRHPLLASLKQEPARTERLVNTYYDTSALRLQKSRIALRIRHAGKQLVQTIKRDAMPGQSGFVRGEWERPVESDVPDLSGIDDPGLRAVLVPRRGRLALTPVFATDFRRTVWLLKTADAEAECALDIGEIRAGKTSQPICEVELELKSGDPAALFAMAQSLNRTVPLRLELASKAARGYALAAGAKPGPKSSQAVQLHDAMTGQTAISVIGQACLSHMAANIEGAKEGKDPEYVHQLRVGIRQLRGALSAFRKEIPAEDRQTITAEMRWLLQEVGPAREWDVLLEETFAPLMKRFQGREGLKCLKTAAEEHRAAEYERLRQSLRSPRCCELLLQTAAWLDAWSRQEHGAEATEESRVRLPLKELAAGILKERHRKVMKLGRRIRKLDAAELHRLRIEIKKLRYAARFFETLWPKRASSRYLAALGDLQNVLGAMNDAAVATGHIEQLAGEAAAGAEQDVGLLLGWISAHLRQHGKEMRKVWERFAEMDPFW